MNVASFSIRPFMEAIAQKEGLKGMPEMAAKIGDSFRAEPLDVDGVGKPALLASREQLLSLVRLDASETKELQTALEGQGLPQPVAHAMVNAAVCSALACDPKLGPAILQFIVLSQTGEPSAIQPGAEGQTLSLKQATEPILTRIDKEKPDFKAGLEKISEADLNADPEIQSARAFNSILRWENSDFGQRLQEKGASPVFAEAAELGVRHEVVASQKGLHAALTDLVSSQRWPLAEPTESGVKA